jgi:hypothetical protein
MIYNRLEKNDFEADIFQKELITMVHVADKSYMVTNLF